MTFRCAAASLDRDEPLAGTASTVRAFLLVEHPGPWGGEVLRDARLPAGLGAELQARTAAAKVRPLLIRRPRGRSRLREGVRVFAAWAHHATPFLERTVLEEIHQVHDIDIEALGAGRTPGLTPFPHPMFCVCTHGRHDTCCAERGRPAVDALLARHGRSTWEVSHIGGDRFAGNMMALPWGLYYGRLDPEAAPAVADALVAGELELDHLRGRTSLALSLQFAEIALRRRLDARRIDAVRFLTRRQDGERTDAVFEVDSSVGATSYVVAVRTWLGTDRQRLTCKAMRDNPVVRHEVLEIRAGS